MRPFDHLKALFQMRPMVVGYLFRMIHWFSWSLMNRAQTPLDRE
jgi:hypothetical protein